MNLIGVQVLTLNEPSFYLDAALKSIANAPVDTYLQKGIEGNTNKARCTGFDEIKNDWISFIDPDDIVAPNAYQKIEQAIRDNPKASLIFTDESYIDKNGRRIGNGICFGEDVTSELIRTHPRPAHHLVAWRRDVIKEVKPLLLRYRFGVEWSMTYAATLLGTSVKIKEDLYSWRRWPGCTSGSNSSFVRCWASMREDLEITLLPKFGLKVERVKLTGELQHFESLIESYRNKH